MGGIIRGFLAGAGTGMADAGRMQLAGILQREQREADALRSSELQDKQNNFTASQNEKYKVTAGDQVKVSNAKNEANKVGKLTNQQKNAAALKNEGYPKDIANGIAYGAIKQVKDDLTGEMVLVNAASNETIGRLTDKGWLPKGEQPENADVTTQHRKAAKKSTNEKAGYFSTDETDFPETGGDRKQFTKNEAQRLANEERTGGIINNARGMGAVPQTVNAAQGKQKYPDGTELTGKDGKLYIVVNGIPVLKK